MVYKILIYPNLLVLSLSLLTMLRLIVSLIKTVVDNGDNNEIDSSNITTHILSPSPLNDFDFVCFLYTLESKDS